MRVLTTRVGVPGSSERRTVLIMHRSQSRPGRRWLGILLDERQPSVFAGELEELLALLFTQAGLRIP